MNKPKVKMFLGDKEIEGTGSYSFSTEKETYKRYMIFGWDEYDNVAPFDCIIGTTDDIEEAKFILNNDEFYQYGCIFDRLEGVIYEKTPG
jgi:hypothetical protein